MKFSIIISCFNQENFIRDAVDSALAQPYSSKEIIVVDDASRDGSVNILEKYGDKIHLIKFKDNQGPTAARNAGASLATGEFLVFLDGDDAFLPWALDTYQCIADSKKPKIILCRLLFFEGLIPLPQFFEFGQEIQFVEYDALIRKDRTFRCSASAIVIEHRLFDAVGGWTQNFFPSETDDLMVKLGSWIVLVRGEVPGGRLANDCGRNRFQTWQAGQRPTPRGKDRAAFHVREGQNKCG